MTDHSEREKMVAGALYDPWDRDLQEERTRVRELCLNYNTSPPDNPEARGALLSKLLGRVGRRVWIEPPFFCDYGSNIYLGDEVFFNFNCVILDPAPVTIGSRVLVGPAAQIYTATHPLSVAERQLGLEAAQPIDIGSDVWIGGAVVLNPGVTIGSGTVIGAGSVVTKDIPGGVFAAGNPCRIIRQIDE